MKATDKQIEYLFKLQDKVNRIAKMCTDLHIEENHMDWLHERNMGMTTIDASMKISAFHTIIKSVNMMMYMSCKNQF